MSKKDYYLIEKNLNIINRGGYTNFLDPSTLIKIRSKLKGYTYQIYYPYPDSDKVILYTDEEPSIRLLEIISYDKLTHREIMGSLYNMNIAPEMFGDIIITNNHYYIIIMESIYNLIINEFTMVGNHSIKLQEVPLSIIQNYHHEYQEITLIVSSLRIDTITSRLIGMSRDSVKKKFLDDEIILNYEPCHKCETTLNPNDIFSIRHHGKYKFGEVIGHSKKDNYIIKYYKYIDN